MEIKYEKTPNPNALKFIVPKDITSETVSFEDPLKSGRSPLAQKLFGFPWAQAVMLGPNFVTVTKQEWVDWDVIADPLSDLLAEHIEKGEEVLLEASSQEEDAADTTPASNQVLPEDSETVKRIKTFLNKEVRPAVAMDGGDIEFADYEEGRVFVRLKGACSGCPSSMMTLKDGIEARMKDIIPEVTEVVSV